MSSLSDVEHPRGRVIRGRAATNAVSVQRTTTPLAPVGGLQLDAPVAQHLQDEGHRAGYDAGYEEGLRAAERTAAVAEIAAQEQLATLQRTFADAHNAFESALHQTLTDLEDALATAAFMLAEAIVGRELAVAENPGRDAIVRALALAPQHLPVTARCNPEDLARIGDASSLFTNREIRLEADPTIRSGDCVVTVGRTEIDATLEAAVARARTALGI